MNGQSFSQFERSAYCSGCNARFRVGSGAGVCPRCGVQIVPVADVRLAETLLLRDAGALDGNGPQSREHEPDPLIGSRLAVYVCESLLGRGGMGRVYLARHTELGRRCALKILSLVATAHDRDYVERFMEEGRAAAALVHPNIVTIHAIGEDRGYHFLEMEFVSGRSLQKLLDDEGRLTPVRATVLACGMANGLAAAHSGGIIHRDLKPDNVLLTPRGIPKIADFGLAKRIHTDSGKLSAEHLAGTPNFMAPELFQGISATPASDVYGLGVCYFLMLTGRLPFVGVSLTELRRSVTSDPLPSIREECPQVPLEIAECLSLLLATTPGNRPRDGAEAAQLLTAVAGQMRDIESLLLEAFRDNPQVSWTRDKNRFLLSLSLPDNRRQAVLIEPGGESIAERLLLIYSICCPAESQYYEQALRLNAEISHGGLSIREIDGRSQFVMIDTYPRATVDPEEIRDSVLEVARRADEVERRLTGQDRN